MNEIMVKFEKQFEIVFGALETAAEANDLAAFEVAVERWENGVALMRTFCEDGRLSMKDHGDTLLKMENFMMHLRVQRGFMRLAK